MKMTKNWTKWHWVTVFGSVALGVYLFTFWRVITRF